MKKIIIILAATFSSSIFACMQLSTAMDTTYGHGNWTQRSYQNGGTDIAPAITAALTTSDSICIDSGSWALKTPIPPSVLSGKSIIGVASQRSKIVYQSANGAAFLNYLQKSLHQNTAIATANSQQLFLLCRRAAPAHSRCYICDPAWRNHQRK